MSEKKWCGKVIDVTSNLGGFIPKKRRKRYKKGEGVKLIFYKAKHANCAFMSGSVMTKAPLCALAHLINALLAGFLELTALFAAIFVFLSSYDMSFLSLVFAAKLQHFHHINNNPAQKS